MTKNVRIENADTSIYNVIVETWEKSEEGDTLIKSELLSYPTALTTVSIWKNRYIIIKEE